MAHAPTPAYINIPPQPGSNPDTPSEIPGTPTSTTTSLSTLSTTAIKDGHRGHLPGGPLGRGHQHTSSTTSLEAERADRISRLAGLERVSTLRAPPQLATSHIPGSGGIAAATIAAPGATTTTAAAAAAGICVGGGGTPGAASSLSPQTTPTSTGFPANFPASHNLTPSYFDVNGQPVAVTKISTVGTASATEGSHHGDDAAGFRQTVGDGDEDMCSTDTNYRETAESVASMAAEPDAMDEDMMEEAIATRSVGGYEDRMSDDGSASLVGFGEGANSTVSGPIYHRRPAPGSSSQSQSQSQSQPQQQQQQQQQQLPWAVERTASAFSADSTSLRRDRDMSLPTGFGASSDVVPVSAAALQERREARIRDGFASTTTTAPSAAAAAATDFAYFPGSEYETFADANFRGSAVSFAPSAGPRAHHQQHQQQPQQPQQPQQQQQQQQHQLQPRETTDRFEQLIPTEPES